MYSRKMKSRAERAAKKLRQAVRKKQEAEDKLAADLCASIEGLGKRRLRSMGKSMAFSQPWLESYARATHA